MCVREKNLTGDSVTTGIDWFIGATANDEFKEINSEKDQRRM